MDMKNEMYKIYLDKNPRVSISVTPGHFTTSNAHSNCYLDVSELKFNGMIAREVAREIAIPYLTTTLVDTIVCMEKTDVIGAYLAEELLHPGTSVINSGGDIHVVSPQSNNNGNLIFPDSMVQWISNQHIILLVATVSSGRTLRSALECLAYYGGKIEGISVLFLVTSVKPVREIKTLFTYEDIPGYVLSAADQCDMCKKGRKLDAIISSEGYTKI